MRCVKHLGAIVVAISVLATAAACGGSDPAASAPAPSATLSSAPVSTTPPAPAKTPTATIPAATAPVVTIKDFAFGVPATVPAGSTVQVKNDDGEAHTVTADSGGSFDTMVAGNGAASFTAPAKPGRYPFHCTYHGNMHGVLVVA